MSPGFSDGLGFLHAVPDIGVGRAKVFTDFSEAPALRSVAFEAGDAFISDPVQRSQHYGVVECSVGAGKLLLAGPEVQPVCAAPVGAVDVPDVVVEELLALGRNVTTSLMVSCITHRCGGATQTPR